MVNQNDPLRFLSRLFEIAVWPFQTASKFQAKHDPLSDQHQTTLLLMPAFLLFIPLCVLISLVAIAYVFFVLPVVATCQWIGARLPPAWPEPNRDDLKPKSDE